MSGLLDDLEPASVAAANPPTLPPAPKPPKSLLDDLEPVSLAPRAATGVLESIQAGFQGSAPGLAWRGKLPDLVMDPQHASWWERALSGAAHVGSELPLMIGGAIAGAPAGAALGTAVAPGVGTAVGSLLGAGAGMGAVPAAIRQTLIEAYKSGDVMTAADFWNSVREVAKTTATEAGINAAAMGAGAVAGRVVGKAIAPAIGQSISVPTAIRTIETADLATQIAAMPTIPAALQGRLPDAQEFVDAAILIGGLKAAHVTAANVTSVFLKTGKTPAEQVADAQANPEVAKQMAEGKPEKPAEPEYVPPSRMEMLKVQENLFTETARLDEMAAKAEAAPLSDPERLEMNALKARVLDLENQLRAGAPELSRTPTYTADQFVEARKQADTRLAELTAKADTEALTDTERAERVFLSNSLDRPTALAKHFGFEPILTERPTREAIDASAQRLHDDVLRQLKDADEARKAAGLEPLGDDHAEAVAALVRARTRTRAERMGVLPETLYAERPVKIEDVNKLQGEPEPAPAAEPGTMAPEAPAAAGPELDLFGEPVQAAPAPRMEVQNLATQEIPLANLILSKDVPQFKMQANKEGVVQPLGGLFDRTGVGPIQVWERLDGTLEVISGRHRLDLARRSGEETIPAQIHREAEGFDQRQAATLDAQLNIREEQGSVADYAQYFKDAGIDKATAEQRGLLARAKGRTGFAIARDASPDLLASHRAGRLSDEAALVISSTAPGSERLQALGIAAVQEGKTLLYASNLMRSVDMMAAERMMAGEQGDIFGFDDSALKEASAMAKKASSKQRAISEQIAAVSGASKRPELARKMGVNVEDPAAVQAKIIELKNEQYLWDNWPLYPELVKQLRGEVMKQEPREPTGINGLKSVLDRYDDGAEIMTERDLVNEIEAVVDTQNLPGDSMVLENAVRRYRDAEREDFEELAGRGDMEHELEVFEDTVRAYMRDHEKLFQEPTRIIDKPETPAEAAARDQVAVERENRQINSDKDLIIQHNVTGANLLHAARMGGIPVPSLAITKAKDSMTSFGEITLLGDAAMADPLGYAKTKVFGADIYSPRYPDISYKLDTKALKKLNEALAPFRQEGEREIYGAEINRPGDLIGNKAFDRYSEANFRDENSSYVDRNAAATAILQSTGAQERIFQGFTESGNRRYKPHTIENIVNILKKDMRGGEGLNYGVGSLRAKFTPQFRSVAQIKANKDRLLSKADFEKVKKEVDENLMEIWNDLAPYSSRGKEFGFGDTVIAVLEDAKTMGIDRALKEYDITDVPQETKQVMAEFLTKLRNLPTEYFEAKITRAVDLAEFRGAVVPDNTSPQILDLLKSRGVEIATYPKGDEGARKAAVAALSSKRTDILFQDNQKKDWYRSALGEAIQNANMKAAPAKGWQDFLKGQVAKGGVKADEIKWSGVEDWLKLQEGKVTKEQVADYLASNGVKVEEVMLGQEDPQVRMYKNKFTERHYSASFEDGEYVYRNRNGDQIEVGDLPEYLQGVALDLERHGEHLDATKFGTYQLPGGENYRELLLTLPGNAKQYAYDAFNSRTQQSRQFGTRAEAEAFANEDATGSTVVSEIDVSKPEFQSSHFPQPNILAHIRFNERTDADGKRVLFIEEIQSDWAQKGKKEGFALPPARRAELDARRAELEAIGREATPEQKQEWAAVMNELQPDRARNIPAAPFVGKTDAWVSLAMKRIIRYAAENGFDKVAWTRGEQQVERYSNALRKQVDVIEWKKTPEGVQLVGYKGKPAPKATLEEMARSQGSEIIRNPAGIGTEWGIRFRDGSEIGYETRRDVEGEIHRQWNIDHNADTPPRKVVDTTEKEDSLSDSIGKAMADQIRNDPNQTGTIEGDQITVSDTGMAGFYDKIVPKVAKEVLKKLGGGKVDQVTLDTASGKIPNRQDVEDAAMRYVKGQSTSDQFRADTGLTIDDQMLDVLLGLSRRGGFTDAMQKDLVRGFTDAMMARGQSKPPVNQPGFEITPAMREGAMAGQPLFQKQTDQLHRGSYDIAENLITTLQGADKSTVVHELTHSWLEEMKADAARPDAPASIKADWEIIRRELAIPENGEISRASHEQFARTGERYLAEGEAPSRELQGVFARFREWLLDIYKSVMNLNVEINPELRQVLDRMLATDEEIAAARDLGVPRAYVPEAMAARAEEIVPPQNSKMPQPGFIDEQIAIDPLAKELLLGPGSGPTQDSRVNAKNINGPMDLKLAIQQIANLDQQNIQQHRGGTDGVRSWEQANAEADKVAEAMLGGKMVNANPRDGIPHDIKQRASFKVMIAIANYSLKMRDDILAKGNNATVQEQFDYLNSILRMRMAHAEFLGLRAAAARAMNQIRDMTPESGVVAKMVEMTGITPETLFQAAKTAAEEAADLKIKLDQIMAQHFSGKSALDIANLQKDIKDLKGNLKFAEKVAEADGWDMAVEGWKNGLLSGPVTVTTNMFGTEAFMFMRPAVDALAAVIGTARGASPGLGESDRASMSVATARLTGMMSGVMDGIKLGWAYFKEDDITGNKTESFRHAIPEVRVMGRTLPLGKWIRTPYRIMGATDVINKTMFERGELAVQAMLGAFNEGLNPSTREFAEFVTKFKDNPPEEARGIAENAAARMTFNAPLGEKGVQLQLFVAKWNLQWMIPFISTPINVAKELLRMSPFAPAIGEWRQAFAKGGVERDRALAEMALGSGIMAITMAYAFAGNVSGAGSPDPGKNRGKAGVWQPYSILIGDTWYEYARIQPTGTLMGMAADMAAIWDHMTDEEKDKVPRMLSAAFAQAITNQTFLQGITNFVNAMSDPARFGPRFLQQMAGSAVPNIIGQPTTMADPVVREVNSALEAIQSRIPGMRQDLLPKRDWLGEPVQTKERLGVVLPVREQQISDDKVRQEAARLDISMAAAPKKTHIGKGTGKLGDVELTPQERDAFEKIGGQFAHGILQNIVNAPGYDQMPDLVKRKIFSNVLTAAHRVAAVQAMPMEKRIAYLQQITEKVQQELAPGDAP